MCYFNGIRVSRHEYLRLKGLESMLALTAGIDIPLVEGPLYNAKHPVLKPMEGKEAFEVVEMDWGFIPSPNKWPFIRTRDDVDKWRKGFVDEKGKFRKITTLNATSENLFTNDIGQESMFADAAMKRRVLMPSTGFFEWRHLPKMGKKGLPLKATEAFPYYVFVPALVDQPFYMAAIWNPFTDQKTGEYVESFANITTDANSLMRQVHNSKNRMPTILNEDLAYEWMFGNLGRDRVIELAKTQFPSKEMWAYPVDKNFKIAENPAEPFDYGELVPALIKDAA